MGGKSWGSGASGYATDYQGTLVLQVYGDQKSVGQTYSMSMLEIGLPADTLTSAKKAGTNPIVVDATAGVWAVASQLTGVPSGKDYLYRICPFAVYRSGETTGNLYACPANNVAFTVGENLEIEGSLVLATDITSADVGVELEADGCYCVNGTTNASIACSSLPK